MRWATINWELYQIIFYFRLLASFHNDSEVRLQVNMNNQSIEEVPYWKIHISNCTELAMVQMKLDNIYLTRGQVKVEQVNSIRWKMDEDLNYWMLWSFLASTKERETLGNFILLQIKNTVNGRNIKKIVGIFILSFPFWWLQFLPMLA